MSYVVVAQWTARAGSEREVERILRELASASNAEPGCRQFRLHVNADEPRVFILYEEYDDADAFAAHTESEHFERLVQGRGIPLLDDRSRTFLTPLDA